jgi:hypothetical protein
VSRLTLSRVRRTELPGRIAANVLFKDDDRFAKERATAFRLLESLPAYQLLYDGDPSVVAQFMRKLLADHE